MIFCFRSSEMSGQNYFLITLNFFARGPCQNIKKIESLSANTAAYKRTWLPYNEDMFIFDEEKATKKLLRCNKKIEPFTGIIPFYHHSSLVKASYINKLNKFLPIYYSVSNFSEKKGKNLKLSWLKIKKGFLLTRLSKEGNHQCK